MRLVRLPGCMLSPELWFTGCDLIIYPLFSFLFLLWSAALALVVFVFVLGCVDLSVLHDNYFVILVGLIFSCCSPTVTKWLYNHVLPVFSSTVRLGCIIFYCCIPSPFMRLY